MQMMANADKKYGETDSVASNRFAVRRRRRHKFYLIDFLLCQ